MEDVHENTDFTSSSVILDAEDDLADEEKLFTTTFNDDEDELEWLIIKHIIIIKFNPYDLTLPPKFVALNYNYFDHRVSFTT